jgi:hypothetical protein
VKAGALFALLIMTEHPNRKPDDQSWEDWIEEKIREAQKQGLFDNLRGQGRPLPHRRNPFLPEEQQLAYDLLRDSGHTLPWIEEGREIDARIARARRLLQRRYAWYRAERDRRPGHELPALEQVWRGYRQEFEEEVEAINAAIRIYNLKVPSVMLHKHILILEEEYDRLRSGGD